MAERRIAEARKPRCIDGIHRADGQGRGLAAGELRRADAGDHHLVGDEHPARGGGLTDGQRRADGGVVVGDVGVGQVVAHRGRPHKGQQRELDGAVAVIAVRPGLGQPVKRPAMCTFCSASRLLAKSSRSALSWLPETASTGMRRAASWVRNQSSSVQAAAGGTGVS